MRARGPPRPGFRRRYDPPGASRKAERCERPRRATRPLGRGASLKVLVRRAIIAVRKRSPLARLALAGGRAAACDAAVERAGLDLLIDELRCRVDALRHGPGDLGLAGDREVAPDVLEERAVGLGEVERVLCEQLHRR